MAQPFLSEIRIFGFGFPPRGWAYCNGQILAISQNQALFALVGTMYGGNGQTTFGLPNLQGRTPMHLGNGFTQGQVGGEENHTLVTEEIPAHFHTLNAAKDTGTTGTPTNATLASPISAVGNVYTGGTPNTAMAPQAISNAGGGQSHNNMQPYLSLNFCIALSGIFPSRS